MDLFWLQLNLNGILKESLSSSPWMGIFFSSNFLVRKISTLSMTTTLASLKLGFFYSINGDRIVDLRRKMLRSFPS